MTHTQVLALLEKRIAMEGSLGRAASALGVSPQLLSAVLIGDRTIGPKLLIALKLQRHRTVTFTYEQL